MVDMDGQTVLHLAAGAGHLDTVEALLDRGCDANVQDFTGHTALQRAASGGHLTIVRSLLAQGASLDHQDELHGNTALHEAAWKGFSGTVSALCGAKANVYMKNRGGFTALHLSCQNGHNQSSRVLLLHGCRPDVKNNYGDTPFHTAARYGHAGVIRILISAKCKVSEQNKNGDTSLHISAAMGRRKLTKILVEAGTDTNIRNKQSETALDIAVRKGLGEVVTILECNNIQNIISDLEQPGETGQEISEAQEVRVILKETSRRSKREAGKARRAKIETGGRGMGGDMSTDLSSMGSVSSSQNSHLRADTKYHRKSSGRDGQRQQRVSDGHKGACDCSPLLEKIGKTIEKDKKDILTHLVQNNKKIESRLDSFEKKTKNQMFSFNQNMKECFANERNDCQERMERRFLKDNIEMERQRTIRDIMIKRDIARWLQARLAEIETQHGLEADNRAAIRKLTRRKSRREARAVISEVRNGGTLRRAHSAEDLASEASETCHVYRGLRISDRPNGGQHEATSPDEASPEAAGTPVRTRVRHNSEGNYDDVSIMQETILNENNHSEADQEDDRVYQNLMFHRDLTTFKNEARVRMPLPIPLTSTNDTDSSCSLTSLHLRPGPVTSHATCHVSDTGSLDSHNDSGYSTRLGISDPASPSLSSITDSEPLLDPQAIYMIPQHWQQTDKCHSNFPAEIVCNSKSSLV